MRHRTGKLLSACILWCAPGLPQAAELQIQISQGNLAEGESFILIIESNRWENQAPDLSPLTQDFEIISNQRSQTFMLLQGQRKQENRWQLELLPKRAGVLRIPPIRIGNDVTKERFVEVQPAGRAGAGKVPLPVFMEVKVEPENPYVHAQAIYTVYLHIGTKLNSISNASVSKPTLAEGDAMVEQMEGAKYEKDVRGQRYVIHELRYKVTPQTSGTLKFSPLEFKAKVGARREWLLDWSDFGLKRTGPDARTLVKRSEPLELSVRPIPEAYPPGTQWLPARTLSLQTGWAGGKPGFALGTPATRLFELTAEGLAAAQLQLPEWRLPDGVRVYPDQPQYEDRKHSSGSTGVLRQGIALIPSVAGAVELPPLEVPWWNVLADRLEYARIPAETILVAAQDPTGTVAAPPLAAVAPAAVAPPVAAAQSQAESRWWPVLSTLLAFAWLCTLALWWHERRGPVRSARVAPPKPAQDLRSWEEGLRDACHKADAAAARAALQGWARASGSAAPSAGLRALAVHCPPLAVELEALDQALYHPHAEAWQGGGRLWDAFRRCRQARHTTPTRSQAACLEPLYP